MCVTSSYIYSCSRVANFIPPTVPALRPSLWSIPARRQLFVVVGIEGFPLPWPFRGEGGSRGYRGAALGGYLCPGPFGGRGVSGVIGGIVFYLGFGTSSYIHSAQDSQICSSHRPRSTSVSLLYTVYTYLLGAIFLLWSPFAPIRTVHVHGLHAKASRPQPLLLSG